MGIFDGFLLSALGTFSHCLWSLSLSFGFLHQFADTTASSGQRVLNWGRQRFT